MKHDTTSWGGEMIWANTDKYSGKILLIKEGEQNSFGFHKNRDKIIFVLQGVIVLVLEGRTKMIGENDSYHIPAGVMHQIKAIKGDATILEAGTTITDDFVEVSV